MEILEAASADRVPSNASPVAVIRKATRELHERLEAKVDLARRLASREAYADLLFRYLALYQAFEDRLAHVLGPARALAARLYRPRTPHLLRDIETLKPAMARHFSPPACGEIFPDLTNTDCLLGALYVVEGSTLGGVSIAREVQRALGIDAASGASFFRGDGEATGSNWKNFTATLDGEICAASQASQAAIAMFNVFEQYLTSPEVIDAR